MIVLLYFGFILCGVLLSLPGKPALSLVSRLAWVLLFANCIVALSYWVYFFFGIKNTTALQVFTFEIEWLGRLGNLVYGYLLGRLFFRGGYSERIFYRVLWAATIVHGNEFILVTVGKSISMPYMITFFHQSGYAVWFLYFIMTAEAAGGIGILLHFRLRTGIPAVVGLLLIMMGAVYTHWHNGDPFSDSYAAVDQLIGLSLLLALFLRERKINRKVAYEGVLVA
jgi:DoxX-like family